MGRLATNRQGFLADFARALADLPAPSAPLPRWFSGLSADELEIWQTLLPIVPALPPSPDRASLLEAARGWARGRVRRFLRKQDGRVADE